MKTTSHLESKCHEKAEEQRGLITREQAMVIGLTRPQIRLLVAHKRWQTIHPGVFAVSGVPTSFMQKLQAAWLWAGDGAVVSHHAAGMVHQFERLEGRASTLDLTVAGRVHAPRLIRIHRSTIDVRDSEKKRGVAVTGVPRTLLDLCATIKSNDARACLHDALRRKLTELEAVDSMILRSSGLEGIGKLRALVDPLLRGESPTQSELESRVFDLIERAGLPTPICQRELTTESGRVRKMDFAIPGTNIIIEADGYAYHSSVDIFEDDRIRANEQAVANLLVFHWTWQAITRRPELLIAQLKQAIARAKQA